MSTRMRVRIQDKEEQSMRLRTTIIKRVWMDIRLTIVVRMRALIWM